MHDVDELDRDLLLHAHVPRNAATIGYLVCGNRPADFDVEARMASLGRRDLASLDPETGWWSITDAGREALRDDEWEFAVEDVLEIEGRGRVVVGIVRRGSIFDGDAFVVAGDDRLGRVLGAELIRRTGGPDGTIALRVDGMVRPGDVLRFFEPLAGSAGG